MIAGKEKAWMGALTGFLTSLLLQRVGVGAGPSGADTAALIQAGAEVGTALAAAAVSWVSVYMTANTPRRDAPVPYPLPRPEASRPAEPTIRGNVYEAPAPRPRA